MIFLHHCPFPKSGPTSPSKYLSTSTRNRLGNLPNQIGLAMLSQKVKSRDNNWALQKKYIWKNGITSSTGSSITWVRFSWYARGITSKPVRLLPLMLFGLCLLASYSSICPLQKAVEKCKMVRVVGRSGLVLAGIMPQTCLALSCAWPASGWAAWKSTTRRRKEPWSRDLHCDWSNEMSSGTQSLRLSGQVRSVVAGQGV